MPGETQVSIGTGTFHKIGHLDMIPRGEGRNVEVAGHRIAVFRTHQDEVFACQANCPHLNGPLADGMLGGTIIMCPLHDRSYDLRTGAVLVGEESLTTYPARKGDDGTLSIYV